MRGLPKRPDRREVGVCIGGRAFDVRYGFGVLGAVCLVLSACGASSAKFAPSYQALVNESDRLAARFDALEAEVPVLPGSGVAEYSGVVVLADEFGTSTTGTIGRADLEADFDLGTIDGTGRGFFDTAIDSLAGPSGSGSPVAGDLTFAATGLGVVFDLTVAGDVLVDDVTRPVSGSMQGLFVGTNAEMIRAEGVNVPAGPGYDLDILLLAD